MKKLRTIMYAGKTYKEDDKNLPDDVKKRLGIKAPRPAKLDKPEPKKENEDK
jgi:hypothetical protein